MLQYSTSTDGIRVHNGLAWRDYNWDGDIVRESEARPGWCIREFGDDHDDEIAATIAAMVRPLDGDIYIYGLAICRSAGTPPTGPLSRPRRAYPHTRQLMMG